MNFGGVRYAASPEETVNYVSAHDNETLFDTIMLKVCLRSLIFIVRAQTWPDTGASKLLRLWIVELRLFFL